MSKTIVKLSVEDIVDILLGGTISTSPVTYNDNILQRIDVELYRNDSSNEREEE